MAETETWENAIPGKVWVRKFNARGELGQEIVPPGRRIAITPQERKLNQEMAASEELDVFSNGTMQPVRLIEGNEESKEIASNPNHLSETDIREVVRGHHKTLEKRLTEIRNPAALQRMLEVARTEDVKVSTIERIKARLAEVSPSLVEEVQSVGGPSQPTDGLRAVTPK